MTSKGMPPPWIFVRRRGEGGFEVRCSSSDQEVADGRLIAAAHELLSALKEMVEAGEFNDWDGRSEAQANARAAIAKATGQ